MTTKALSFLLAIALLISITAASQSAPQPSRLHSAAKNGDVVTLRAVLDQGVNPDLRDARGRTPLMEAAAAGQVESVRALIAAGAHVNVRAGDNRTPLIEAVTNGQIDAARLLVSSGAELNTIARGWGTPLEAAERAGQPEIAAMLRSAGARSMGRSQGDTVCVRPWGGEGYCGVVESVNKTAYRIRVTQVVGCKDGCAAKTECSASRTVGGHDGIAPGDRVDTVSWCLTHTGVQQ